MSGEIQVTGDLNQIFLKGNVSSYNGLVHKLKYDSLFLTAEGIYPNLQILKLTIAQSEGLSFILNGPFNIKDQANFKKQFEALNSSPLVKESDSQLEWTIKRSQNKKSESTDLKYFLRKIEDQGTSTQDHSGTLGIERKMEF